jgi:hypothetical protein
VVWVSVVNFPLFPVIIWVRIGRVHYPNGYFSETVWSIKKVPALTNAGTSRRVSPLLNPPFTKKERLLRC